MDSRTRQAIPSVEESSDLVATAVERDRRVRVLEIGTLAMCGLAVVTGCSMWAFGVTTLAMALTAAVVASVLNLIWLRLGASVDRIGNLSVGIFFSLVIVSIASVGGFHDPTFAWLYAVPVCAAWLVDNRSSVYWAGAVALTTLGFWAAAGAGVEFPNVIPEEQRHLQALFNRLCLLVALMVFAMSFAKAQRRSERSLAQGNDALHLEAQCVRLLQHAAVAANESDDFDLAIDTCVERVLQTTGWRLGQVWEPLSDESGEWACRGRVCSSEGFDASEVIRLSRDVRVRPGVLALGRVLEMGQPVWASRADLQSDPSPRARAALEAGLNSAVAIPIMVRGNASRIIEFFGCASQAPNEKLIAVLCDVGHQLGRVADRVRLQESVRRSQKLESVGQLAAGMAHEINNPMAYVRANLRMLQQEWGAIREEVKQTNTSNEILDRIENCDELIVESLDGVDRTVAIVSDMREFARDGSSELEAVELAELVESSLRVAATARPDQATVATELEAGLEIHCLPTRMRQVFLNLVVNAFHAIREGGKLRITARSEGERVLITFEDDGHGIESLDRERIFEPFYTTKPAGQGTGLGLYITFEIVRWHGGSIDVDSAPGLGARFALDLPLRPSS